MRTDLIEKLSLSRAALAQGLNVGGTVRKEAEEGGCGVVGFCCSEPVAGKHIHEPSRQMHNRGNGKGGGIAAVGFVPEQLGVTRQVLDDHYMLHIAFLDNSVRRELEKKYIAAFFDVHKSGKLDTVDDWKSVAGLEVKPPDVWRYFVRVKPACLSKFVKDNGLEQLDSRAAEDEFVNQNSFKLNQEYYASLGEKKAFVMSHGRDIMILKVVGYAEAITQYYKIEDLCAHVWIAHQRFPTKGRVWHPGGAHPFAAINMALVHNGDFANYHSVTEYLLQRNIHPQFLTDTEVSALLFDLLDRTYHYPLEYIIEALAPTTELDFDRLPEEKQRVYQAVQATHIHGSPDGPWFFIIARNMAREKKFQLLGITDTAMLRPQVFAFHDGQVQVGLIASEKQAIDATLQSLAKDDKRICPVADRYWNARGGSHTDGGSFMFTMGKNPQGQMPMSCTDKFGTPVTVPAGTVSCDFTQELSASTESEESIREIISERLVPGNAFAAFEMIRKLLGDWTFDEFRLACRQIVNIAKDPSRTQVAIEVLTLLHDRRYSMGSKKRSHIIHIICMQLGRLLQAVPIFGDKKVSVTAHRLINFDTRELLRAPVEGETTLVIDAAGFPPEGRFSDASILMDAYMKGWRKFITFNCRGQRYVGCGLGPNTDNVTIEVYGSSGDYLASGLDGLTINVHGNAQDQVAQIIKRGKLIVHGDVGQTFMYGAKGGAVYILGNAAGRPLINSVGKPRVVINGTCLDFLAESFMAGDPLNGGGFVVLNGVKFDDEGNIVPLPEPYPGSNIFSLASGGAIYVRDPQMKVVDQQLNGGEFASLSDKDWDLIRPYLEENEKLFGIAIEDLLTVDGKKLEHAQVYRKIRPKKLDALSASEDAVPEDDDVAAMVAD